MGNEYTVQDGREGTERTRRDVEVGVLFRELPDSALGEDLLRDVDEGGILAGKGLLLACLNPVYWKNSCEHETVAIAMRIRPTYRSPSTSRRGPRAI